MSKILPVAIEPTFNALQSERIDFIRGLNYYANNHTADDSKAFALKWAKKAMPEIYPQLKKADEWKFQNYGFILRMAERGFFLNEQQLTKIKAEFRIIAGGVVTAERVKEVPVQKVKKSLSVLISRLKQPNMLWMESYRSGMPIL